MYREIVSYDGNFGDPIDWGPYDPLEVLEVGGCTSDELDGVSIAAICQVVSACDNATFSDSKHVFLKRLTGLLETGNFSVQFPIVNAAKTYIHASSEEAFYESLGPIYQQIVLPDVEN